MPHLNFTAVALGLPWPGITMGSVLKFFAESDVAEPPAVVRFKLEWKDAASPAHSTVKRRFRPLESHGLFTKVDEDAGYYAILNDGRAYLAGELDVEELV